MLRQKTSVEYLTPLGTNSILFNRRLFDFLSVSKHMVEITFDIGVASDNLYPSSRFVRLGSWVRFSLLSKDIIDDITGSVIKTGQ